MEDRSVPLVLIGEKNSRRSTFFQKAAVQQGQSFSLLDWEQYEAEFCHREERAVVKIDPPSYSTADFLEMKGMLDRYLMFLQRLEGKKEIFLNTPSAILQLLNKEKCKIRLQEKGVPVTPMVASNIGTVEELLELLLQKRIFSAFIKPIWYSGAAGVVALRLHPRKGKMVAYTSCAIRDGVLYNTKNLRCIEDRTEIVPLLQQVLSLSAVVERWQPKALFQGKSYDLRVVCQFGHVVSTVVRQSSGPITNLHLNNQALSFSQLGLSREQEEDIEQLCRRAMEAFDGLNMAGIDILLDRNTLQPYVIEMNGQGDLIYQDIYGENRIYREQVRWMAEQGGMGENVAN